MRWRPCLDTISAAAAMDSLIEDVPQRGKNRRRGRAWRRHCPTDHRRTDARGRHAADVRRDKPQCRVRRVRRRFGRRKPFHGCSQVPDAAGIGRGFCAAAAALGGWSAAAGGAGVEGGSHWPPSART